MSSQEQGGLWSLLKDAAAFVKAWVCPGSNNYNNEKCDPRRAQLLRSLKRYGVSPEEVVDLHKSLEWIKDERARDAMTFRQLATRQQRTFRKLLEAVRVMNPDPKEWSNLDTQVVKAFNEFAQLPVFAGKFELDNVIGSNTNGRARVVRDRETIVRARRQLASVIARLDENRRRQAESIVKQLGLDWINLSNRAKSNNSDAVFDALQTLEKNYGLNANSNSTKLRKLFMINGPQLLAEARLLGLGNSNSNRDYVTGRLVRNAIDEANKMNNKISNRDKNMLKNLTPLLQWERARTVLANIKRLEANRRWPPPDGSNFNFENYNNFKNYNNLNNSPATRPSAQPPSSSSYNNSRRANPLRGGNFRFPGGQTRSPGVMEQQAPATPTGRNTPARRNNGINNLKTENENENTPNNSLGLGAYARANGAYGGGGGGGFRVGEPISDPDSMANKALTRRSATQFINHVAAVIKVFGQGDRYVPEGLFRFERSIEVRFIRQHLLYHFQNKVLGKKDPLKSQCMLGKRGEDVASKLYQRAGRIMGVQEGSSTLKLQLFPKSGSAASQQLVATVNLFADKRDRNNRLGVVMLEVPAVRASNGRSPPPPPRLPVHVRFIEYGDESSIRAALMLTRLVVCNRFPHFVQTYGASVAKKAKTGVAKYMVFQEATHGTLADWLMEPHTLPDVAHALTQVLLALAVMHGRRMQHGNLTPNSICMLRSRATGHKNHVSQYRVGDRDIYLTGRPDMFLLDPLAPSIRRSTGDKARHCEVSRAIRMFKGHMLGGRAPRMYDRLITLARQYRHDAVMFLYNPEVLRLLQLMSGNMYVRVYNGRAPIAATPGHMFDVVPKSYDEGYTGGRGLCNDVRDTRDMMYKFKSALAKL